MHDESTSATLLREDLQHAAGILRGVGRKIRSQSGPTVSSARRDIDVEDSLPSGLLVDPQIAGRNSGPIICDGQACTVTARCGADTDPWNATGFFCVLGRKTDGVLCQIPNSILERNMVANDTGALRDAALILDRGCCRERRRDNAFE